MRLREKPPSDERGGMGGVGDGAGRAGETGATSRRRVRNMRMQAEELFACGKVHHGLSPDDGADVIWTMNSSESSARLVFAGSWEPERCDTWLADAWKQLLLRDEGSPDQ